MADSPEVPDLKKALENKPAGFAWTPGSTVAKAAASAAAAPGCGRPRTARERLMALGRGKLALIALAFLTIGGLAFSYAAFRFGGTADGGSPTLGGVASSMKIRFARQNDPTGFIVRERAAAGSEKMRFDLIKGAAGKAPGATADGEWAPGENGDAPMNYDDGPASRPGAAAAAGGGGEGAAGPGEDGGPGGTGGLAGGGAPRLTSSASSIKFQGMRRISGTAGFRGIQSRRGSPNSTIQTRGSSATPFGAAAGGGAASGGSAASAGRASGAAGVRAGPKSDGDAASGGGSAGGGGGGGAGGDTVDTSGLDSSGDTSTRIADLFAQAKADRDKAEDEKKKAIALKALGQDPQAAYHYDRYQKLKESAEKKADQATSLTAGMTEGAGNVITPPSSPP